MTQVEDQLEYLEYLSSSKTLRTFLCIGDLQVFFIGTPLTPDSGNIF